MAEKFIYARRASDGSEVMINPSAITYASFRENAGKRELYLRFGKDDGLTVHPDIADGVWEIIKELQHGF